MRRFIEELIRERPLAVVCAFLAATALAAAAATGIRIDTSIESLMVSNDPARELNRLAKREFRSDELVVVAFELARAFTAEDLHKLGTISERIAEIDGVQRVVDLSNVEDIRARSGDLDTSALVDPATLDRDIAAIHERVHEHPLYRDLLVSSDARTLAVLVFPAAATQDSQALHRLAERLLREVAMVSAPWKPMIAGYPVAAYEANRLVRRDLALLTPIALAAICAVLLWYARRPTVLLLFAATVAWVEAVTLGWLAATDTPLSAVMSSLPTIVLATSATYVIYAVGLAAKVADRADPGVALLRLTARPALLSAASTAIGFLSLCLIRIEVIVALGIAISIAIAATLAAALLLIPALVQLLDLRIDIRAFNRLGRVSLIGVRAAQHPYRVICAAAALALLALPGITSLRVHTDTLDYFRDGNPIRENARRIRDSLSSGFVVNLILRSDRPNGALDPAVTAFAAGLIDDLQTMPNVDRSGSILDYFYLLDGALNPERPPVRAPASTEQAAQYLLLYEASGDPESYARFINYDRSALSIVVHCHGGTTGTLEVGRRATAYAAANAPDRLEVDALGSAYLYSQATDTLTRGMLSGLLTAVVLISLVLSVGLRSPRLAAIAILPNIAPVLACTGVLGWLGIPLTMGASLVGCMAVGLAVDDTAHVLGHFKPGSELEPTYRSVGPALILTTVALGLGLGVLSFSEFEAVSMVGMATALSLVVALAADLVLLPSLLVVAGFTAASPGRRSVATLRPSTTTSDTESARRVA